MSSTPSPQDEPQDENRSSLTGRQRLDTRWWWSPAMWMVVGVGVIVYQSGPISTGDTITLTWVMVAVGALVAVRGAWMLWTAWTAERAGATGSDASSDPPAQP